MGGRSRLSINICAYSSLSHTLSASSTTAGGRSRSRRRRRRRRRRSRMMHPATEPQKQPQGQPWPVMMQQQQQHQLQHQRPSPSPNMHQNQPLTPQQQQQPYMMQPTHSTTDVSSGYPSSNSNTQSPGEVRTLWIGDLQLYSMNENYINSCLVHIGEVVNINIIRTKQTMATTSNGYIEFNSHLAAKRVLQTFTGALMPQTKQAVLIARAFQTN